MESLDSLYRAVGVAAAERDAATAKFTAACVALIGVMKEGVVYAITSESPPIHIKTVNGQLIKVAVDPHATSTEAHVNV